MSKRYNLLNKRKKRKVIKKYIINRHENGILFNLNDTKEKNNKINIFSNLIEEKNIYLKIDKKDQQKQTLSLPMNISNFYFQYLFSNKKKELKIDYVDYFPIINNRKYINNIYNNNKLINYKPKGLENFSLNCYMNSLLQCFYYIKHFRDYFLSNEFEKSKSMCNSLKDLMIGLNKKDGKNHYAPKIFKNEIKKDELFADNKGADVTDLFFHIFDKLIYEFENNNYSSDKVSANYENNVESKKVMFNDALKDIDPDIIINKLFVGFYESEYKCKNGHTKYYFQNEYHILLPLQEIHENLNYKKKNLNIYDCFNYLYGSQKDLSFDKTIKKENIIYDDDIDDLNEKCDKCKENYILTEKIYIPPKILVIILDRGKNKKYNINVNFDETIDLNNYIDKDNNNNKYLSSYKLIGIVSHFGKCGNYGHYKAICLCDDNNYYQFNDTISTKLKKKDFYDGSPYILFYQRNELNELGKNIPYSLNRIKRYIKESESSINKNEYIVNKTDNNNKYILGITNKMEHNQQFILEFDFSEFNIYADKLNIKIREENKEENTEKWIQYKWNEKIDNKENVEKVKKLIDKFFKKFSKTNFCLFI